jgi:hypothetical protein
MTPWLSYKRWGRWLWKPPEIPTLILILISGMAILGLVTFPNYFCGGLYNIDVYFHRKEIHDVSRGSLLAIGMHVAPSVTFPLIPIYLVGDLLGIIAYQWFSILFGAVGIYLYAKEVLPYGRLWPVIQFFGMWGLYSALAGNIYIDFVGAMGIPYLFYFFHRKKWFLFSIAFLFVLLAKEHYSMLLTSISIGLLWIYRKENTRRDILKMSFFILIALLYLFLATKYIIPYYCKVKGYAIQRIDQLYKHLWADNPLCPSVYASTLIEKVKFIACNWRYIWTLLWVEPPIEYMYGHTCQQLFGIKWETHMAIILSGGWTFLYNGLIFLFILLPVYIYKLLSMEPQMWGTMAHYSIEFAVVLPIALIWSMRNSLPKLIPLIGFIGAFMAHLTNYLLMEKRFSLWYYPQLMRWYSCEHYCPYEKYKSIRKAASLVPKEASYCTDIRHAPYISVSSLYRENIEEADYVFAIKEGYFAFPLDSLQRLKDSGQWETLHDDNYTTVLRRKK